MQNRKIKEFENELENELEVLISKYNMKNSAFCGSTEEGEFFGIALGKPTIIEGYTTAVNVGRMWQHMRSAVRDSLNLFDRWSSKCGE